MPLVSAVHTDARILLNDTGSVIFSDGVLLPITKIAYLELQDELALNGLQEVAEEESAAITVAANTEAILAASYPSDLIHPLSVFEADAAASKNYSLVVEGDWEPGDSTTDRLARWKWKENEIKLLPCTVQRFIKIKYVKFLTSLVDVNSSIPVISCQSFLSKRVAAIAAVTIGGNLERGDVFDRQADKALNRLVGTAVKRSQSNPTRRLPFRSQT